VPLHVVLSLEADIRENGTGMVQALPPLYTHAYNKLKKRQLRAARYSKQERKARNQSTHMFVSNEVVMPYCPSPLTLAKSQRIGANTSNGIVSEPSFQDEMHEHAVETHEYLEATPDVTDTSATATPYVPNFVLVESTPEVNPYEGTRSQAMRRITSLKRKLYGHGGCVRYVEEYHPIDDEGKTFSMYHIHQRSDDKIYNYEYRSREVEGYPSESKSKDSVIHKGIEYLNEQSSDDPARDSVLLDQFTIGSTEYTVDVNNPEDVELFRMAVEHSRVHHELLLAKLHHMEKQHGLIQSITAKDIREKADEPMDQEEYDAIFNPIPVWTLKDVVIPKRKLGKYLQPRNPNPRKKRPWVKAHTQCLGQHYLHEGKYGDSTPSTIKKGFAIL